MEKRRRIVENDAWIGAEEVYPMRRLIAVDERSATFKVKNYRIEGPGRYTTMTLDVREFIRRFLITCCPRASIASVTTACSQPAIAPRRSREHANS